MLKEETKNQGKEQEKSHSFHCGLKLNLDFDKSTTG